MVKSQETDFSANQLKKKCKKSSSKESMTDSYEMKHSVIEWLKMVETNMFVDNGMLLQMKIIQHKNIIITRIIGGLLLIRQVPILCLWSTDLTSNKHCLPCSNSNKKKELYKRLRTLAEINNGHRVLLLHGGVGKVHGGLLIPMKVTMEINQVLIEQGDLLHKYLEQFFWAWFSRIQLFCYRWIVYSWRRSTVTDGGCKYNTSNDMFSRCKSVHKMATGKGDDQLIQYDNQLELGTSYKSKLGPRWNWDKKWTLAMNAWWQCMTRTPMTTWPLPQTSTLSERERALSGSFLSVHRHAHTHRGSSNESFIPSTCPCSCERFSSPCSPLLLHALPAALPPLPPALEVRRLQPAAHSAQRGYGLVWRVSPLHRLWAQRLRLQGDLGRALHGRSWTHRRSTPTKSLLRTPTTMTLHSRVCFTKLTEYIAITLYEKTCLSVCRRQCPIERGDPLEIERCDPLSNETRKHRLGLCSTNKKSKFFQNAKQELTDTNFKPLTTEEAH